ncbi:hypothetical protein KDI_38200 [Dictyobacter arantiisoli]|uniref:Uncharacterized protein n=2 Tax=Dictyobacter arantiisoli TaxID=2014874 RepID=A0A5A5TGH4_9CHLR|nr:hypothetical protein KDI_38200 [Dictyobacter arantiisoli]
MHTALWLERLAGGTTEARQRLLQALAQLWPATPGLFEPLSGESLLL